MRKAKRTVAIVALALASCSSPVVPGSTPTAPVVTLRLHTAAATAPLTDALTTAYMRANPTIAFQVTVNNYEGLVAAVTEQREDEPALYFLSNYLAVDSPLWAAPIGQDGIAIIAHPDVAIGDLTTGQLRDIFQGQITDWEAIGAAASEIVIVSREAGSGTRAVFEQLVMGSRRTSANAVVAPSSTAMVATVARTPGSIGYVSLAFVDSSVNAIRVNGIQPTSDTIFDNSYPLRTTLFIIGEQEPADDLLDFRAFIGWVQSPDGQRIVANRYVPLTR